MGRLARCRFVANSVEHKSLYWLASGAAFFAYAVCLCAFLHVTGLAVEPSNKQEQLVPDDYGVVIGGGGPLANGRPSAGPEPGSGEARLAGESTSGQLGAGTLVPALRRAKFQVQDLHIVKELNEEHDERKRHGTDENNGAIRKRRSPKSTTTEPSESLATNSDAGNSTEPQKEPLFPEDLFTKEERQRGAVILHMLGVIYMFVALAIVCDEFFVPSLDVIIEKLGIPDDVAGATFMAAGGSAPELFTSVIGVFVSFDDVGIGTIVGSAVFNILFVIGMCALFSKTILTLTWWPLFRDCSFYSLSLIALVLFFLDNHIVWWEAALLLAIYACYVGFMRWNERVERFVKGFLYRNTIPRISSSDHLVAANSVGNRGPASQVSVSSGGSSVATGALVGPNAVDRNRVASAGIRGSKFRHGLLTLMIHSIDPMHDGGHVDDKANKLHAIASLRVLLDATKEQTMNNGRDEEVSSAKVSDPEASSSTHPGVANPMRPSTGNAAVTTVSLAEPNIIAVETCTNAAAVAVQQEAGNGAEAQASDEEESRPLDLSWPQGTRKRLTYIFLAPILWPLWLTLPDTRTPQGKRFFAVTFLGSIIWIAAYSYLMVWWANLSGETFNIPPEVMGLTFLAAGTSIPDLITSVIVARKGLGDMAVSSSVGSNIFDICVGLPFPWLLYCIIKGIPVEVNSAGMACSVLVLFGMLCFVVLSIACFRWKMNKALGFTMFIFYFVFVAVSLGFEYGTIVCPV